MFSLQLFKWVHMCNFKFTFVFTVILYKIDLNVFANLLHEEAKGNILYGAPYLTKRLCGEKCKNVFFVVSVSVLMQLSDCWSLLVILCLLHYSQNSKLL